MTLGPSLDLSDNLQILSNLNLLHVKRQEKFLFRFHTDIYGRSFHLSINNLDIEMPSIFGPDLSKNAHQHFKFKLLALFSQVLNLSADTLGNREFPTPWGSASPSAGIFPKEDATIGKHQEMLIDDNLFSHSRSSESMISLGLYRRPCRVQHVVSKMELFLEHLGTTFLADFAQQFPRKSCMLAFRILSIWLQVNIHLALKQFQQRLHSSIHFCICRLCMPI